MRFGWSNLGKIRDIDRDDVLGAFGLQSRTTVVDWILPGLGIFGLGVLVGAGIGVFLAPKSGEELREDVKGRLARYRSRVTEPVGMEEHT